MYQTTGEYLEPEVNTIPYQIQRDPESCRVNMRGLTPHPSKTFPRIPKHNYYQSYCQNKPTAIQGDYQAQNVIVNLGKNGNIEVSQLEGNRLIKKIYPWNKIPPLQPLISRNVPEYIRNNAWDPKIKR